MTNEKTHESEYSGFKIHINKEPILTASLWMIRIYNVFGDMVKHLEERGDFPVECAKQVAEDYIEENWDDILTPAEKVLQGFEHDIELEFHNFMYGGGVLSDAQLTEELENRGLIDDEWVVTELGEKVWELMYSHDRGRFNIAKAKELDVPREITKEQIESIYIGIGNEGFAYYFCDYTSPEMTGIDPEHKVFKLWKAFSETRDELQEALEEELERLGLSTEDMEY